MSNFEKKSPEARLKEALALFNQGNLPGARMGLKTLLPEAGDLTATVNNHLGIIALMEGYPQKALPFFKSALKAGGGAEVLLNLGISELAAGRLDNSIKRFETLLMDHPDLKEAGLYLGQALLENGRAEDALAALNQYLAENPTQHDALLEKGMCLEALGQEDQANGVFEDIKTRHPKLYITLYQTAERLIANNFPGKARGLLERAARLAPKDPIPNHMIAIQFQELGDFDRAETYLKKSIAIAPTPESYSQLASLYEKSNKLNDAWATAKLGLSLFNNNAHLTLTLARVERRAKRFEDATNRLEGIFGTTGDPKLESQIGFQLGWLYDQADEIDLAFEKYLGAKTGASRTATGQEGNKEVTFHYIEAMKKLDLGQLPKFIPKTPKKLAFLVGFPRSGTTLLNQILDAHPALTGLEEFSTLPAPAGIVEEFEKGYPEGLADIDEATFETMRATYFDQVRNFANLKEDTLIIDKLPLNLIHLPLIWTMFPEAKIILALRHPMGSALSNFMHNFKLNNAMANMFSLDDITRLYAGVMGLWAYFEENKEFSFHIVKYEDVVQNIQREAEALCKYLNVPWSETMLDFSTHARSKGLINTPSYHQVTQPLYSESLERWKRYEKYLNPYKSRLEPFCKKFGYDL